MTRSNKERGVETMRKVVEVRRHMMRGKTLQKRRENGQEAGGR